MRATTCTQIKCHADDVLRAMIHDLVKYNWAWSLPEDLFAKIVIESMVCEYVPLYKIRLKLYSNWQATDNWTETRQELDGFKEERRHGDRYFTPVTRNISENISQSKNGSIITRHALLIPAVRLSDPLLNGYLESEHIPDTYPLNNLKDGIRILIGDITPEEAETIARTPANTMARNDARSNMNSQMNGKSTNFRCSSDYDVDVDGVILVPLWTLRWPYEDQHFIFYVKAHRIFSDGEFTGYPRGVITEEEEYRKAGFFERMRYRRNQFKIQNARTERFKANGNYWYNHIQSYLKKKGYHDPTL